MEDIRNSFLNTLDHLPCDIIRTLWTLQSLELRGGKTVEALNEAKYLATLIKMHRKHLEQVLQQLRGLVRANKQHGSYLVLQSGVSQIRRPLKIRISLRKSQLLKKQVAMRSPRVLRKKANERVYCFCRNVSYGQMIACDSNWCQYEWFHYGCVGLKAVPKDHDKWYCSENCRKQASRARRQKH